MEDDECLNEFRVRKCDLPILGDVLGIPDEFVIREVLWRSRGAVCTLRWTPQVAAEQLSEPSSAPVEPPTGPPMVTPDQQEAVALLNPPTAPTGPPAALIGPTKSPIGQSVSLLAPSVQPQHLSQNLGERPHSPEGPSAASPVPLEEEPSQSGFSPSKTQRCHSHSSSSQCSPSSLSLCWSG
ncbi:unnamed protein product [Leuciscus chuanchicus]